MTNKRTIQRAAMSMGLAIALSSAASAATLANWENVEGEHGIDPWVSATHDSNMVNTPELTIGTGTDPLLKHSLMLGATGGPPASTAMKYKGISSHINSVAKADSLGSYLSFTFDVASGFKMDVTQFQLSTTNLSALNPILNLELRSSADSFGSTLGTIQTAKSDGGLGELDFGSIGLEDLTGSVEFRLYTYWDSVKFGTQDTQLHFRNTDTIGDTGSDFVRISGNIVPEPSSAALLGLGGLTLILRRRK